MQVVNTSTPTAEEPVAATGYTYRDLLSYHTELQQLAGSVFFKFNQDKINDFIGNNGTRINGLIEKLQALNVKYFVIENKLIQRAENGQPVLLEGQSMDDYNTETNELLDQPCEIKF